jgi:DNA-binding SARP family transcriptional activator
MIPARYRLFETISFNNSTAWSQRRGAVLESIWLSFLGPLQVETEGTRRLVPAAKQRALLGTLAVNANNVVPAETLAEAMWGAVLPPSKQDTTRTYVHRLRKCLGPEGQERVLTQPPGYMLQVRPGELDLLRFETLAKEGRTRLDAFDWAGASFVLTQAEALWRGTPLADIPSRVAHDRYIHYLEQTRLTATELRIEADVRISPYSSAGVIPELQRLVTAHPERERLGLLLMLALYRSGRQAEALKVFRTVRNSASPSTASIRDRKSCTCTSAYSIKTPCCCVSGLTASPSCSWLNGGGRRIWLRLVT